MTTYTDSQMADACAYAAGIVYEHFGDGLDRSYALRSAASRLRGLAPSNEASTKEQAAVPREPTQAMVDKAMWYAPGKFGAAQWRRLLLAVLNVATDQPAATDHGVWQPLVNACKAGVTIEKLGEMARQIAQEQT